MTSAAGVPDNARAWVVTVSDRASTGVYEDTSGPLLAGALSAMGFSVVGQRVVPDEEDMIVEVLAAGVADRVDLVVTTGGTGLAPRDVTPEATRRVVEREVPGIAEALRAAGREMLPAAMLSRGVAGVSGATLVVNLPGSTGGVRDGVALLATVVGHAVAQVRGGGHGNSHSGHGGGHDDRAHGHGDHGGGGGGEHVGRGRR